MTNPLHQKLDQVEKIAKASKIKRMLAHPFHYCFAILFRELIYSVTQKGRLTQSNTFFDIPMQVLLPSGTDIYITRGKSHDSEIRLARLLINQLSAGDSFVDVGAHYGYFSLLASQLCGAKGKIYAVEASQSTFSILQKNVHRYPAIQCFHNALTNVRHEISFYEFPVLYAEYNSFEIDQFKNESWFKKFPPRKITVQGIPMDEFIKTHSIVPKIIKIDVEGAEYKVISGALQTLKEQHPMIILEYLSKERHNQEHTKAVHLLKELNYSSFVINSDGSLHECKNIDNYLTLNKSESDNIVFIKGS